MPVKSKYGDTVVPDNVTFHELILSRVRQHAQLRPDKRALIDAHDDKRFYTFGDVNERSNRFAGALYSKLSLRQYDVVLAALPTSLDAPIASLGTLLMGGVLSLVNPLYNAEELQMQIADCQCKCIVCTSDNLAAVIAALNTAEKDGDRVQHVVVVGTQYAVPPLKRRDVTVHDYYELIKGPPAHFVKPSVNVKEDLAFLPYSSGTTGRPKGVMLTHYNCVAMSTLENYWMLHYVAPVYTPPLFTVDEYTCAFLPFFHIYGLCTLHYGLARGSTSVVMGRFEPQCFLQTVEKYRVRFLYVVPPVCVMLAKHPLVDNYDLSSVKMVCSGAAPMSQELEASLRQKLPSLEQVQQGWGMTELSMAAALPNGLLGARLPPGNAGVLITGMSLKVIDPDTGRELAMGERGEICIKGPTVMKGYLRRPDATRATIDEDGWLHTGDIGYYNEDHVLFVVDRIKELIKVKGFQVAPAELEGLLLGHPAVADCAVIGVADDEAGELPRAYVVLKPTHAHTTAQAIADYVSSHVSHYKRLAGGIEFMNEIPKSASGKILRRLLRERQRRQAKL